jgi:electron transfer flavoprotein alpha subunit
MTRRRIDPRAVSTAPGRAGRLRLARSGTAVPGHVQPAEAARGVVREVVRPTHWIAVVPDFADGALSGHDLEAIGFARWLADRNVAGDPGGVLLVLFGGAAVDAGAIGVDRVLRWPEPDFAGYAPEARALALAMLVARESPRNLVFPESAWIGADLGRRFAATSGEPASTSIVAWDRDGVVRSAAAGREELHECGFARVLLLEEGRAARPRRAHVATEAPGWPVVVAARVTDAGRLAVDASTIDLADAEFVIGGGNGVRDWLLLQRVAQRLNAAVGGSRVVVDAGILPRARQIGATGTLLSARVYLALGISGAPQHLQGVERCQHVLAVNADPTCPMAARAGTTIVGDVQPILQALARHLELAPAGGRAR